MWDAGLRPGDLFDAATASPLLLQYIAENKIPPGRALVPGCGRGYDVTALAAANRFVIGLDISETAIKAAEDRLHSLSDTECSAKQQVHFSTASFFDLRGSPGTAPRTPDSALVPPEEGQYDFVYDYTFLCALGHSVRGLWADQMARVTRPGGELLTLVFPIRDKPDDGRGPPFTVSLQLMRDLLEPRGFECLELEMLPPELCHEGRDGTDVEPGSGKRRFMARSGVGRWRKL
jgi:methyl halide transferase